MSNFEIQTFIDDYAPVYGDIDDLNQSLTIHLDNLYDLLKLFHKKLTLEVIDRFDL